MARIHIILSKKVQLSKHFIHAYTFNSQNKMIDFILQRGCYKQRESNLSQVNTCLPNLGGKADIAKGLGHKIQLIIKECCENSDGKSKSKKPSDH